MIESAYEDHVCGKVWRGWRPVPDGKESVKCLVPLGGFELPLVPPPPLGVPRDASVSGEVVQSFSASQPLLGVPAGAEVPAEGVSVLLSGILTTMLLRIPPSPLSDPLRVTWRKRPG